MQRESHLDGSSVEVCADKLVGYSGDHGDARSYLSCRTLDETGWDVRSSKVYRGLNNRWVASSAELSRKPSSIQPRETMHDQVGKEACVGKGCKPSRKKKVFYRFMHVMDAVVGLLLEFSADIPLHLGNKAH